MAKHKFSETWIDQVPHSSKRTLYIDSSKETQFNNCSLVLVVGARTKTAYLRHRTMADGRTTQVLEKLGDAKALPFCDIKEIYNAKVVDIAQGNSPLLVEKKIRKMTLGEVIDFYVTNKKRSDAEAMMRLKDQPYGSTKVGLLRCADLNLFKVKKILREDVEDGKLYQANMKREFIVRVWNYAKSNHEQFHDVFGEKLNPGSFSMKDWCGFEKKASTVHLPKEDYSEFFKAVDSLHREDFIDLMYMFLYTGQHPYSEVCQMRWDQLKEVEGQWWWIMEEGFHKTKGYHSIPLHPMVMDIINKYKDLDPVHVFANVHSRIHPIHNKDTFKNILKRLKRTHNITWDIRCLRASFLTTISQLDLSYRGNVGILANHGKSDTTQKHYIRGEITYYEYKVNMINDYMDFIQDKLNEVSR